MTFVQKSLGAERCMLTAFFTLKCLKNGSLHKKYLDEVKY